MDIDRLIDASLRRFLKLTEAFVELSFLSRLSYSTRKNLGRVFWGYHFVVLALFYMGPKGSSLSASTPLIAVWGVYFAVVVLLYLPLEGLVSLYDYLRRKDLPASHALSLAVMTVVGVISTALFLMRD